MNNPLDTLYTMLKNYVRSQFYHRSETRSTPSTPPDYGVDRIYEDTTTFPETLTAETQTSPEAIADVDYTQPSHDFEREIHDMEMALEAGEAIFNPAEDGSLDAMAEIAQAIDQVIAEGGDVLAAPDAFDDATLEDAINDIWDEMDRFDDPFDDPFF